MPGKQPCETNSALYLKKKFWSLLHSSVKRTEALFKSRQSFKCNSTMNNKSSLYYPSETMKKSWGFKRLLDVKLFQIISDVVCGKVELDVFVSE